MKTKKLIALLLAFAMVLGLAACSSADDTEENSKEPEAVSQPVGGSESDAPDESDSGTLSGINDIMTLQADAARKSTANSDEKYDKLVVPNDEVADLFPYNNTSASKSAICVEIYEPLFDLINNELVPHLASGYTEVDDTHVQVTLYDNIYDWEGNNITASDVVFSYGVCMDSGYAEDFGYFEKMEAVDSYVIEFTWNAPITSLTAFNSMLSSVCIVSEKAYGEHNFAVEPVGTGPYILESFTPGVSVLLKANDNYWQTDESLRSPLAGANVKEIEFDVLTDATMQVVALQSGALDYCEITTQNIESYIEDGSYNIYSLANPFVTCLLLNQSDDSPCKDVNLRLAIYYAIDNQSIVNAIGAYAYYPATCSAATCYSDYQAEWSTWENYNTQYDIELAKEYLEKSDYNGETLTILTNSLEYNKNAAQVVQGLLGAIGINATLNTVEPPAVNEASSHSDGWDLFLHPGNSKSGLTIGRITTNFDASSTPTGLVTTFTEDATLDEMLAECNSKDGYSVEKTTEIMQYLIDNVYTYGLFGNTRVYAFNAPMADFALYNQNTVFVFGSCDYYLD